jgi:hypothetical protein
MTLTHLGMACMLATVVFTWWTVVGGGVSPIAAITEAWVQIVIGFALNFCINLIVLPMLAAHPHVGHAENFWMGWVYTLVSLVRSYGIRRWLGAPIHSFALRVDDFVKTKQNAAHATHQLEQQDEAPAAADHR